MNNKKAYFNYNIEDKYTAGLVLLGTEVKSIRDNKVSFNDSFCLFQDNELWIRGLHIAEFSLGTSNNHNPLRDRKLLLHKKELKKLQDKVKEKGFSIVPIRIFFTKEQFIKLEIGLGKGKKTYDKKDSIKEKDLDRDLKRILKK